MANLTMNIDGRVVGEGTAEAPMRTRTVYDFAAALVHTSGRLDRGMASATANRIIVYTRPEGVGKGTWRCWVLGAVLQMLREPTLTSNPLLCLLCYLNDRYPDTFSRPQIFLSTNMNLQPCPEDVTEWLRRGTPAVLQAAAPAEYGENGELIMEAIEERRGRPTFGIHRVQPLVVDSDAREADALVGILLWAVAHRITTNSVNAFLINRRAAALSIIDRTQSECELFGEFYPDEGQWFAWCAGSNRSVGCRAFVLGNMFTWANYEIGDDHEATWATLRLLREHGVSAFRGVMNLCMHAGDLIASDIVLSREAHAAYPYLRQFGTLSAHEQEYLKATMGASYTPMPNGVADNLIGAGILYTTAGQRNGNINRPVRMNAGVADKVRRWLRARGVSDPVEAIAMGAGRV
jgi:hypothetical protein